jgi:hypothetical protein
MDRREHNKGGTKAILWNNANRHRTQMPPIPYNIVRNEKKINGSQNYLRKDCGRQFPEIDEFWTYIGEKKNKVWLIYAYHWESGEIAGYVWGKRDLKTAKKLRYGTAS